VILRSARVRKYKSITDSGTIKFEPKVTALVGKNEAGKTAVMEALYRLNPAPTGHEETFDALRDYPRAVYNAEKETAGDVRPVSAVFDLEPADIAAVEDQLGKGALKSREVEIEVAYKNKKYWDFETGEAAIVRHFAKAAGFSAASVKGDTIETFIGRLQNLTPPDDAAKAAEIAAVRQTVEKLDADRVVIHILTPRVPKFLYFNEYSTLLGRASIPRLQAPDAQLKPPERTALALVRLAGAETVEFLEAHYEARKATLEAAANQVTDEVFRYWSQNKDLSVLLDVDFKSPEDQSGAPPFLNVRINNSRHRVSLNVGERSAGFLWFFSFVAFFSDFRRREDRVILLLDEPALGLHAEAQKDLLRYIDERLAPKHQVIYSTHSLFMIKPEELQRIRTVEDLDDKGTVVGDDILLARRETISPVLGALGISLAQTLVVGPDNLVVQGASDHLYLIIMSGHLRTLNRTHLDARWEIVAVGGLDKVPTFVALLGSHLRVAVLVDSAAGGSQRLASMVDHHLLEPNRLLAITSITGTREADVEDMFEPAFYLQLLKAAGGADLKQPQLTGGDRITKRIERAIGKPYDHYSPARYFLENQVTLLPKVDAATLDRFEELFKRLNPLLPTT